MKIRSTSLKRLVPLSLWGVREYFSYTSTGLLIFPSPIQVFIELSHNGFALGVGSSSTGMVASIGSSMYRVLAGLIIALVCAVGTGSVLYRYTRMKTGLLPVFQMLAPIAPIAWISIALALFGIGNTTAIVIVFMGVYSIFTLAILKALENIPAQRLHLSKLLGHTPREQWYKVIIPSLLPTLVTLVRINFMAARMALLAAEMTGLRDGLGAIIMTGRNLFNYHLIVCGMILIGLLGYIADSILIYIQKTYAWR